MANGEFYLGRKGAGLLSSEQIIAPLALAPLYDRVVIKVSGESLGEDRLLERRRFTSVAQMIAAVHSIGVTVTVVVGGGNIFRGANADEWGIERDEADDVGMASTGVNVLLLKSLLRRLGLTPAVFSRGTAEGTGQPYDCEQVRASLQNGAVALLAGGLGKPGISTDVTAVDAAIDTEAPVVIMSKHGVDGVYTSDPHDPRDGEAALFIPELTVSEALEQNLQVMDAAALSLARRHGKLIHVIPAAETYAPRYVLEGKEIGSRIIPM
jgi:uridylate kinase